MNWPKEQLKRDVQAMLDAVRQALLSTYGKNIVGIYFKGSAKKEWDSSIDYIPGISDVDIHVQLKRIPVITVSSGMRLSERIEKEWKRRAKKPMHMPEVQISIMNIKDFVPSPQSAVRTLFGKPYAPSGSADSLQRTKKDLLECEEFLQKLPDRILDKPGKYLHKFVKECAWRMSPAGAHIAILLGTPYDVAWSMNRTQLVKTLKTVPVIAKQYRAFYQYAYAFSITLDENKKTLLARKAVRAAVVVLEQGIAIARKTNVSSRP